MKSLLSDYGRCSKSYCYLPRISQYKSHAIGECAHDSVIVRLDYCQIISTWRLAHKNYSRSYEHVEQEPSTFLIMSIIYAWAHLKGCYQPDHLKSHKFNFETLFSELWRGTDKIQQINWRKHKRRLVDVFISDEKTKIKLHLFWGD